MSYSPGIPRPQCYGPEGTAPAGDPKPSRLRVVGLSMAAIASLPRRLLKPPPRHPKLQLRDVLAGRHCSPISLIDFEHYLAHTEHSVENLYFTMWLEAYTDEYAKFEHADGPAAARLSASFISAARTYVEPDAPFEINITAQNRSELLALPAMPPPAPGAYDAARRETWSLLEDSLRRFEKRAKSNAGRRRLAFSTYLGLVNTCGTIVAMVLGRVYLRGSSGRIFAAFLTPFLWFSVICLFWGLSGICFLCFGAGGAVRQVSSFELSLPRTPPNIRSITTVVPAPTSLESPRLPHAHGGGAAPDKPTWAHADDLFSLQDAPGRGRMLAVMKALPDLPTDRCPTLSKTRIVKFWAPMVEVEDPLIVRAHWEVVVRGYLCSLVVAIIIGVIVVAV